MKRGASIYRPGKSRAVLGWPKATRGVGFSIGKASFRDTAKARTRQAADQETRPMISIASVLRPGRALSKMIVAVSDPGRDILGSPRDITPWASAADHAVRTKSPRTVASQVFLMLILYITAREPTKSETKKAKHEAEKTVVRASKIDFPPTITTARLAPEKIGVIMTIMLRKVAAQAPKKKSLKVQGDAAMQYSSA